MKCNMLIIKEINPSQTHEIRLEVLRKNIALPVIFTGDDDPSTIHLGVFLNDKLVAISSFMQSQNTLFEGKQYQLRGMATLPEHRGLGAGSKMMLKAFELLKQRNTDVLWCNARIVAVDFYKKLGLKTIGDKFEIKPIGDHYVMAIAIKKIDENI